MAPSLDPAGSSPLPPTWARLLERLDASARGALATELLWGGPWQQPLSFVQALALALVRSDPPLPLPRVACARRLPSGLPCPHQAAVWVVERGEAWCPGDAASWEPGLVIPLAEAVRVLPDARRVLEEARHEL